MSCWTLWQRLPPRYQLTTKEGEEDTDPCLSTPRSAKSPRSARSPRAQRVLTPRSTEGSPPRRRKVDPSDCQNQGRATMYFTVTSPRDPPTWKETGPNVQLAFPIRKSSFINSFKQQQRINSAMQSFQDPSTATPKSQKPKSQRAKTAPQFPITRLRCNDPQRPKQTAVTSNLSLDLSSSPRVQTPSRPRLPCKSAGTTRQTQMSINTISPFAVAKPFVKNPLYPDPSVNRYVVRHPDNSTAFIDNDKVVFVKKNGNGQSLSIDLSDNGSYLSHLRKLYLKEPKDAAKLVNLSGQDHAKKRLIRERLDYEKRTDHILSYYSRVDDVRAATAWTQSVRASYHQNTPTSTRASSSRERRRAFSPISPRRASPRTRPNSARYLYEHERQEGPHSPSKDALEDWNVFLKINSRSVLHERQFYLQTPANRPVEEEKTDCSCRLCHLEMEVAMLRQKHGDHVVLLPQSQPVMEQPSDGTTLHSEQIDVPGPGVRPVISQQNPTDDGIPSNSCLHWDTSGGCEDDQRQKMKSSQNADRKTTVKPQSEVQLDLSNGRTLNVDLHMAASPTIQSRENTATGEHSDASDAVQTATVIDVPGEAIAPLAGSVDAENDELPETAPELDPVQVLQVQNDDTMSSRKNRPPDLEEAHTIISEPVGDSSVTPDLTIRGKTNDNGVCKDIVNNGHEVVVDGEHGLQQNEDPRDLSVECTVEKDVIQTLLHSVDCSALSDQQTMSPSEAEEAKRQMMLSSTGEQNGDFSDPSDIIANAHGHMDIVLNDAPEDTVLRSADETNIDSLHLETDLTNGVS